jgi:hypothetical protein
MPQISDEKLDLYGNRFISNRVRELCGITFERYLSRPDDYDKLVRHMKRGGGCRRVAGDIVAAGRI